MNGVSHIFEKGDVVKASGSNGSGKSTMIKLMSNMYTPNDGYIFYNGIDIRRIKTESLQKEILYVNQDETFLNESVSSYLREMAKTEIDEDKLAKQMKLLGLELDRDISLGGLSLSVGQRKKLLILKLIYRLESASVIILDEIFAGFDADTKTYLEGSIGDIARAKNEIIFVINHEEDGIPYNKTVRFGETPLT